MCSIVISSSSFCRNNCNVSSALKQEKQYIHSGWGLSNLKTSSFTISFSCNQSEQKFITIVPAFASESTLLSPSISPWPGKYGLGYLLQKDVTFLYNLLWDIPTFQVNIFKQNTQRILIAIVFIDITRLQDFILIRTIWQHLLEIEKQVLAFVHGK